MKEVYIKLVIETSLYYDARSEKHQRKQITVRLILIIPKFQNSSHKIFAKTFRPQTDRSPLKIKGVSNHYNLKKDLEF